MKNIIPVLLTVGGLWLTVLTMPSCKKTVTKTVIDTLRKAWQPVPLYNSYGSPALSAYNLGDSVLVVAGTSNLVHIPVKTFNNLFGYFLPGTSLVQPAYEPVYIDAAAFSFTTATTFYVSSNPPGTQFSLLSYTPKYTPGEYSRFVQQGAYPTLGWPAASYPLIRDRYALTPVETIGGTPSKQVRFDLISWDSAKLLGTFAYGDTPHVKRLTVNAEPSTIGFFQSGYFCAAYYNKFFVFYEGQFFRIDTAGNIKAFGYTPAPYSKTNGVYNMFTVGNTLFINSGGIIWSSTDQGESWQLFNDFSNTTAGRVVFRNIGPDLYATYDDLDMQLWKVVIDGNQLNFSELNNDGLQSNLLTSLTRCGPYVFVTTPTGIFYRDTALFNQLKAPIR